MANVCVITGGGSGMGLATARNIDKDTILVLTGRTVSKLENAKKVLESEHPQERNLRNKYSIHSN